MVYFWPYKMHPLHYTNTESRGLLHDLWTAVLSDEALTGQVCYY